MFELRLSQGIKCRACDGFTHDHSGDCPQGRLTAFCTAMALREYHCPKCHRGFVAINRGDFYECRKCHMQFSTGPACGEPAESLERTYILTDDQAIQVLVMTSKGLGEFRDDAIVKMLRQEVDAAIARREPRRRKRTPSVYQRLMKEIRDEEKKRGPGSPT